MAQHPEQMQRIEVARVGREATIVELFRRFEMPPLMERERLLDIMRRLRLRRGGRLAWSWLLGKD